ncbi:MULTISPECIES: TetR/AcrR family transcriptional regulator [unclassified Nocardiopsis]|uniref:TetR/AcrR family transcriptional regulator n=1 Tax=unclassified Nocardiopsis TaxID=2649073 RepID=UPI001356FD8E|nr:MULTISPECIES: TetR/AcrR family transcriptional regulator [unclassified Nocardiopsis]
MTERRRQAVRLEIARAAVRLFTRKGVAGTTGEDIAHAVGVSTRTLWRYFPTKESCVRPLLTSGLHATADLMRRCPRDVPLLEYLEEEHAPDREEQPAYGPVADLIRMTRSEPALMAVWLEVHHAAEAVFARILAERTGASPEDLEIRVQAATFNVALRLAAEEQVRRGAGADRKATGAHIRAALAVAARGLPAFTA